jgi:4-hydroxy-tetrahydrodipicolinate reductase
MATTRVGVLGCAGRMGQLLVREVVAAEGMVLAGGTATPGHEALGQDVAAVAGLAPCGIAVGDDAAALFAKSDAVIDFTAPDAAIGHANLAAQAHAILVVGTSGLEAEHEAALEKAGRHTPVVIGASMSIGVNLLLGLVRQAAALGTDFDIEIVEMHHKHKVDAPSGTALALGRAAAAGRGVDLGQVKDSGRDGLTGPRRAGDIGFAALRGGDVTGEHTVIFAGTGERVELGHRTSSRQVYARGAVRAVQWAADNREPGFYTMADVLGFSES